MADLRAARTATESTNVVVSSADPRAVAAKAVLLDLEHQEGQALFGFAVRLGLSDAEAQDAVQESFLRLWAQWSEGTCDHEPAQLDISDDLPDRHGRAPAASPGCGSPRPDRPDGRPGRGTRAARACRRLVGGRPAHGSTTAGRLPSLPGRSRIRGGRDGARHQRQRRSKPRHVRARGAPQDASSDPEVPR